MGQENVINFCFTINNYVDEHVQFLQNYDCTYVVFGYEIAPETGTPHLQGYIQLRKKRKFLAVAKELPWHIVPALGDAEQNRNYCTKGELYYEHGEPRVAGGQSQKDRWSRALVLARSGDWETLGDEDPGAYIHSYRNLRQIHTDFLEVPEIVRSCVWLYGPPGCGKTRYLRSKFPGNTAFWKLTNKWFDGYRPLEHEAVILDDLQKCHAMLGSHLLRWADRYPVYGETKGGTVGLRHKFCCVTSNHHPRDIFEDAAVLGGIERRFQVFDLNETLDIYLINFPLNDIPV